MEKEEMNVDEKWYEFQKEQNVGAKMFFYECFNEFKGSNEKEELKEFSKLVKKLGNAWNVSRTVPKVGYDNFARHLYSKLEDIKSGTYKFWDNKMACLLINKKHAYSYESKVCFCINPKKYYLIYDSNNCTKLKEKLELKKNVILKNFFNKAEEYILELEKKPKTEKDYFEVDFDLWFMDDESEKEQSK